MFRATDEFDRGDAEYAETFNREGTYRIMT
jgi:hypothetical protein